jgi:hypothetical protein
MREKYRMRLTIVLGLVILVLSGCASPLSLAAETEGEKFRRVLRERDAACKKDKLGPYLDPTDPEYKQKEPLRDCDILKVQPFDLKRVLETPGARMTYAIRLPPPLDQPQVRYSKSMAADAYFAALCEKEAGDFVFATADNVERVRQLRIYLGAWKDRLGSYSDEVPAALTFPLYFRPEGQFVAPRRMYRYLEMPDRPDRRHAGSAPFALFEYDGPNRVSSRPLDKPTARYAFTWRTVEREHARELGIVGGELIVLDLHANTVLAVRRAFLKHTVRDIAFGATGFDTKSCRRRFDEAYVFIAGVLKPAPK